MTKIIITLDLEDFFYDFCREQNFYYEKDTFNSILLAVDRLERILLKTGNPSNFTIFVTGSFVDRHPDFIYKLSLTHEISSHLYYHDNVSDIDSSSFSHQIEKSINSIINATNIKPIGYRSPNFNVKNSNYNSLNIINAYFKYDSSLLANVCTNDIQFDHKRELPIPYYSILGFKFKILGGSFLKIIPFFIIDFLLSKCRKSDLLPQIYIHPYELIFDFSFFHNPFKNKNISLFKKVVISIRQCQWLGPANFLFYIKLFYILKKYKHIGRIDNFLMR